ncbi:hypothetical protein MKW92_045701 [Papaver armeniacum]|nr:hypothetical protein MKW92_045701 [Papaver armeniacum]
MAGLAQNLQNGIANLSLKNENASNVQVSSSNVSIQVVDKSKGTHHIYTVTYYKDKILTTVTHTACIVDHWISEVYRHFRGKLNNLIVGLDIEWSRLRRERGPRNKVAILQLCLSRRCLIFQFSCCDKIPKSLFEFLGDKQFIFVGVGIDGDIGKLLVDHGLKVGRSEDLGSLADCKLASSFGEYRRSELYKAGMKTLTKVVLNQDLPKPYSVTLSNWDRGLLSESQIEYACLDALVSYKLGFHLLDEDSQATSTNGSEKVVKQTKATERTLFVARSGTENTIGFKA